MSLQSKKKFCSSAYLKEKTINQFEIQNIEIIAYNCLKRTHMHEIKLEKSVLQAKYMQIKLVKNQCETRNNRSMIAKDTHLTLIKPRERKEERGRQKEIIIRNNLCVYLILLNTIS